MNSLIPYVPQPKWKPNFKFRFKINQEHVSLWSFALLIFVASGTFWRYSRVEAVSAQPTAQLTSQATLITANDVKPYAPKDVDAETFIKKFSAIAQAQQKIYHVPASISLAQALVEGKAGTSFLAVNAKNHFGMKCFSNKCKKGHCVNRKDDSHKDFFLKFEKDWQSFSAHAKLLSKGRYAKLKRYGKDYRAWSYGLKQCGYATDKKYAETLIGVIEKYDLHKFD